MRLYDLLKQATLRSLPDPLLQPLKKLHYARVLEGPGTNELEASVLPHLVRLGDVVLDLGANFGGYTKLLSGLVGERGTVISVEPVPRTCEILRYNIERHRLANVQVVAAAVSDQEGTVEMEVPQYPSGGENYYRSAIVDVNQDSGRARFTVAATTVDTICPGPVHFIKCDVEGHEEAVIRGARRTIETHRPAWLVEVSNRDVLRSVRDLGYQIFVFDGVSLRWQSESDRPINSFFLTEAHLATLQKGGVQLA